MKLRFFLIFLLVSHLLASGGHALAQSGASPANMTTEQTAEHADLQTLIQSSTGATRAMYEARLQQLLAEVQGSGRGAPGDDFFGMKGYIDQLLDGCNMCGLMQTVDDVKTDWAVKLYAEIAPEVVFVLKSIIYFYILYIGTMIVMNPGEMQARAKKTFFALMILGAVLVMLQTSNGTPYAWLVIREIELSALKLAVKIISFTIDQNIPLEAAESLYAIMTKKVEGSFFHIVTIANQLIHGGSDSVFGVAEAISRAITGVIMMIPYLFVIGIFLAFLVEAMFKFAAISMISPLMLPALIFEWSRAYPKAALRICFGAFLTIVFAAMAMSLTVRVVDVQIAQIIEIRDKVSSAGAQGMEAAKQVCPSADYYGDLSGIENLPMNRLTVKQRQMVRDQARCQKAWAKVSLVNDAGGLALNEEYFKIVIIGFLSILLHIQSKTLASNISGAQDGAGPAAAVVAATKVALAAPAAAGLWAGKKLTNNTLTRAGASTAGTAVGDLAGKATGKTADFFRGPPQSPVNPSNFSTPPTGGDSGTGDTLRDLGKSALEKAPGELKTPPEKPKLRD
ncbi:hypothetical protein ACFL12_00095 [Pseudomonadota bacterium]